MDGVDFDLRRGEVHVLFGENGAGKSTLINIIAGTFPPDTGSFKYQGKEIVHLTPHGARIIGISPVFQEFSLVPELTVEQNLFLGRELTAGGFLNRPAMRARARSIVRELNFDLRPDYKVSQLSRAHQQMVEIAKAFLTEVRLLILDEPTASLTDAEAAKLFDLVGKLKASGVGIIYVSHRMREIKRIADRITVLRDGHKIKTVAAGDVSENELVELMTKVLEEDGRFEVKIATTGFDAGMLVKEYRPDMLVLDVMLPDTSGVEVCRTLKNDRKTASVTIVMLTAKAQSADLEEAEDAGADGYFTKPFSPVALLRRVDKIFKGE